MVAQRIDECRESIVQNSEERHRYREERPAGDTTQPYHAGEKREENQRRLRDRERKDTQIVCVNENWNCPGESYPNRRHRVAATCTGHSEQLPGTDCRDGAEGSGQNPSTEINERDRSGRAHQREKNAPRELGHELRLPLFLLPSLSADRRSSRCSRRVASAGPSRRA